MYTIHLDTSKIFECTLKLKGVSAKNSKVNLVIESEGIDIRCRGTIEESGKVNIPIKELKGILEENITGKLYVEVIADDNYFTPFKSEYITELSKKVENTNSPIQIVESNVPKITYDPSIKKHARNIIKQMKNEKINIFKPAHKNLVVEYIKTYISTHNLSLAEHNNLHRNLLNEIIKCIS